MNWTTHPPTIPRWYWLWTTEPPTSPGWYWVLGIQTPEGTIDQPIVVHAFISPRGDSLCFFLDLDIYEVREVGSNAQWAGPLPLPEHAERSWASNPSDILRDMGVEISDESRAAIEEMVYPFHLSAAEIEGLLSGLGWKYDEGQLSSEDRGKLYNFLSTVSQDHPDLAAKYHYLFDAPRPAWQDGVDEVLRNATIKDAERND